jgi:hypothetical protein
LNCFFGALTAVFVYRIARALFSARVAAYAGWATALFPSLLVWSATTVKEPVIIFLETLALYGCVRLRQSGFSPRHLLLCAAMILALVPFRFYAAYLVGAAVLLSLVAPALRQPRTGVMAVVLAAVLAPVLIGTGLFARHEAELERFDLQRVQAFREAVSTGDARWGARSGVRTEHDLRTTPGFGMALLVGGAHLLLAPFPWQLGGGSLRMLLTLPELLVWWWMFFFHLLPGLRYVLRWRLIDVSPLLLQVAGFGLLYSLMFGNVGLALRQRAQLLPWLFIIAAVGMEQRAAARRARAVTPAGREVLFEPRVLRETGARAG